MVTRVDPAIWKLLAFGPARDNVPENAGNVGDIVTSIEPTTVPDSAPPGKVLLERPIEAIDWAAVTLTPKFAEVLAARPALGARNAAKRGRKTRNRERMILSSLRGDDSDVLKRIPVGRYTGAVRVYDQVVSRDGKSAGVAGIR